EAFERLRQLELLGLRVTSASDLPVCEVEHLALHLDAPPVHALLPALVMRKPLRSLAIRRLGDESLAPLADAALTRLELSKACVETLPHLPSVTAFELTRTAVTAIDWIERLPALRRLRITEGLLTDAFVIALAESPHGRRLVRLDLSHNHLTAVGAR